MMQTALEMVVALLLGMGGLFGLVGSYGLIRLKDAMQRLHAPTKASTLGLGAVLAASAIAGASWQEVLVMLFIFLTAPLTAIYLAKTLLHGQIDPSKLPPAAQGAKWASQTHDGQED